MPGVRSMLAIQPAPAGPVYATWNPADKSASVTLSGGNLIATGPGSGSGFFAARSTVGKSSGKWYWEITTNNAGNTNAGIGSSGQTLTPLGDLSNLEGLRVYYPINGHKYTPDTAYGASWTTTDVIGFALDMDAGTLVCYKNNSSQGTLVSGLSGTIYAYCSMAGLGGMSITANFGASALTYSPPGGFNAGLYV